MTLKISDITGFDFDRPVNGKIQCLLNYGDDKWVAFNQPIEEANNLEERLVAGEDTGFIAIPQGAIVDASWFQHGWRRTRHLGHGES